MTVRQAIRQSLALLTRRDRRLLGVSAVIQMSTSLLDLVGVLLLGLVGALAVTVIQSQPAPASVQSLADALGLGDIGGQQLVLILALAAAIILLLKSVASSYLTRRVFKFLANRQALVSGRLVKELLSRPLTFIQKRSSQETSFALIQGAGSATMQILGQSVVAVTEIALLVVLSVALLLLDPWIALGAIAFFSAVALLLQRALGSWAHRVGRASARADIDSLNAIQESLRSYREITVADRRALYGWRIGNLRWDAAKVMADVMFIGMLPKYVFEASLVVGGFALAGILFATQDSVTAVGTLALFLAAASRVMPSILRLQGAMLSLRSSSGIAQSTFALAEELGNPLEQPDEEPDAAAIRQVLREGHSGFAASISLRDVTVTYPGAATPAIRGVSFDVPSGASLALVGMSGAGKSTLADVILGILTPDLGQVLIDGVAPAEAITRWPGGISYVPQDVVLANETVRKNVALGLPDDAIDDEAVWEALRRAHLSEFLQTQREGLDTHIGESGVKLSGGQRQRLGIARALYSRPKLIVLDEATSALDAETEAAISLTIRELEGDVTTVIIAHRLSTIRHVDQVAYLENGIPVSIGTFDSVRRQVVAFDRQVQALGM